MKRRFACALLGLLFLLSAIRLPLAADSAEDTVLTVAAGIIAWKKADNGAAPDGYLLNDTYLALAGTTAGDWYPIGLGRLGISDNNAAYLAVIRDKVETRYRQQGKLSSAKATEWHRITLAVLAMGGDPTALGTDADGSPINLIADGTYDRGKTVSLGRQGINGWIWGLIALDSLRYEVPRDAYYTRDSILTEILRQQLADGGFALSGKTADPDITAMALQALAPYYNSEKTYTYVQKVRGETVTKTVRQVADEAINCLSALQLDTGDFASWGTENVESTDQVTVALCSLGIDPLTDPRFIKNGNTLLDGILRYRMADGGFVHSYTYDPDNPTSLPDRSNTMAGEQTLYTMAALWRQRNGMRMLYDFRPEQSEAMKARIAELEAGIGAIGSDTSVETLTRLLTAFYALPETERCYVTGYWTLSDAARAAGVDVDGIAGTTQVVESPSDTPEDSPLLSFTRSDRAAVDALPERLTTEQYVTVTTLLDKLRQCEEFDGMDRYLAKLTAAKREIAAIRAEIDSINAEVREKLYPFDRITLKDRKTVDGIVARYNALSEYDRTQIERWEDVIKTKTKLDNMLRGIVIGVVLSVIAAVVAAFLVRRIRRRRHRKERELEELAAQYRDEP
ncbi:MAG TPA: hypothetical protein DDW30_00690 [Clostridiales bacterium]|nr:hypothetical protein [Clostridiales bacterium]